MVRFNVFKTIRFFSGFAGTPGPGFDVGEEVDGDESAAFDGYCVSSSSVFRTAGLLSVLSGPFLALSVIFPRSAASTHQIVE
jgi:hypothetical protein